jgi:hypothetical protein
MLGFSKWLLGVAKSMLLVETVAREGEIDPRSDEIDAQAGRNERVARRNRLSFLRGAAWLSRNGCEVQRKSLKIFANFA